jgi:hypothetical protein
MLLKSWRAAFQKGPCYRSWCAVQSYRGKGIEILARRISKRVQRVPEKGVATSDQPSQKDIFDNIAAATLPTPP